MRFLFPALFAFLSSFVHAEVSLLPGTALVEALQTLPPCCVIDARSEKNRKHDPLAEALPYEASMRINPTATVVVVSDSDRHALKVAQSLAAAYPGSHIVAVKGGVKTWRTTLTRLEQDKKGPLSFVIPKNTCESGSVIQQLKSSLK